MNLGGMGRSKSAITVPLRSAGTRVRLVAGPLDAAR